MHIKLKVTSGSHAGKEIAVTKNRFLIGRGEDCHLRPQSDMVSRQHCEITINGGKVTAKDMGSRNGTIVNGEVIEGPREIKMGDLLKVGPLEFEVMIDHSPGGAKRSQVKSVQQAAARAVEAGAKANDDVDDGDVTGWLTEADEADRARRIADPETRQYKLDETDQVRLQEAAENAEKDSKKDKKKKKEYGKLPDRPEDKPKDTRDAAERMLRKFFDQGTP
jgi:pSer/pThr/pTyr-binding forkhead associated (FHA) protein